MADCSDTVIIAAALIQSGQFKLADFDNTGQPSRRVSPDESAAERFTTQAEVIGARDWRTVPALVALRKLTDVICRALSEPMQAPTKS